MKSKREKLEEKIRELRNCYIKKDRNYYILDFNTIKNITEALKNETSLYDFFRQSCFKHRRMNIFLPIIPAKLFLQEQESVLLCEYHPTECRTPNICCIIIDNKNERIHLAVNFSKFLIYEFENVTFSKEEIDFMIPLHLKELVSNIAKYENNIKFRISLDSGGREALFTHSIVKYCLDFPTAKELLMHYLKSVEEINNEFENCQMYITSLLPEEKEKIYKVSPTVKHASYFDPQAPIERKFLALSLSERTFRLDKDIELFVIGNNQSFINFLGVSKLLKRKKNKIHEEIIQEVVIQQINTEKIILNSYIEVNIPLRSNSFEKAISNIIKNLKTVPMKEQTPNALKKTDQTSKVFYILKLIKSLYESNRTFKFIMDFHIKKKKAKGIFLAIGIGETFHINNRKNLIKLMPLQSDEISFPSDDDIEFEFNLLILHLNFR